MNAKDEIDISIDEALQIIDKMQLNDLILISQNIKFKDCDFEKLLVLIHN